MKNQEISKQLIYIIKQLDSMTYNHSVRVMMISSEIEEYLGMTDHKLMYDRPYHRGVTSKEALKILTREGGYDTKVLEYITEVASRDDMGTSAIHRMGQEDNKFEFVKKLIMEMEL